MISLLLLKVDLTESEKKRFEELVKRDIKAAEALSKNFIFKIEEVEKPYSHSILVKPNDYAKQEDILVNDLRDTLSENNLDLDKEYFNALNEVEDTDSEISFLLRKYTKTLDEEGKKEAKMLFTQKDGIEDLSKDLKTQVKELNKVIEKNLEIRLDAYIKLMEEELAAVKVKDKKDFSSFSEKEILQPEKKDSILNAYYSKKKKSIENTMKTIEKLIKRLKEKEGSPRSSLLDNFRNITDYLDNPREIRPVGTTEVDGKEIPNIDTAFDRHKKVLTSLLKNMLTLVGSYEDEGDLEDRINALQELLGEGELGLIEDLMVKKDTMNTTNKMTKAIKYKGSLASFVKKTLLEKNENAVRRNNKEIRKRLETILGKEVTVIDSRVRFLEQMKTNANKIKGFDVRDNRFVDYEAGKKKLGEAGGDSLNYYTPLFKGYTVLMKNGERMNQELNKRVDSRTLFEYILDYAGEKGSSALRTRTQKKRKALGKLSRAEIVRLRNKVSEKIKESPLIKKYGFDKLQNLLLSDYSVIEEAVDEMKTRGITSVESMERMSVDFTSPEDIVDYLIGKIDSTYFPNLPPTFYPMSEGQNRRITILITRNILKIMTKLGIESNFSEEERATILQRLEQNEEEE